ncbi:Jip4 protein [Martiniozyma asiatica (nom. inval.)]|nr:Jip4 protein [Martiniozyma asiatica]
MAQLDKTISFGASPRPPQRSDHKSFNLDFQRYAYHTVHLTEEPPNDLKPKTPDDILEQITGRCSNCISQDKCPHVSEESSISATEPRPILVRKSSNNVDKQFQKSVSFDTVNTSYSAPSDSNLNLNSNLNNSNGNDSLNRGRWGSQNRSERALSPSHRSQSPGIVDVPVSVSVSDCKYPTIPIITHDSCTLTRKHALFDDMYAGRLKIGPKLPNRDIMCYISGRKHTWPAIDWCCNRLLEDGDSLIIVSSIRPQGRSLSRLIKRDENLTYNITNNKIRNSPEWAQTTTENIMKYVMAILNPNRIVKITVELSLGSTDEVLTDMFNLYQPSLVVSGCKPTKSAPTKQFTTKRLTDRLVMTLPVPMIVVTSKNLDHYQIKLLKAVDKRMKYLRDNQKYARILNDEILKELDEAGTYSLEDRLDYLRNQDDVEIQKELKALNDDDSNASDVSSVDSDPKPYQPIDLGLKTLELQSQVIIYKKFSEFEKFPLNESSFKNLLCGVMDTVHDYHLTLAEKSKTDKSADQAVRNLLEAPPRLHRTKSMLDNVVVESNKETMERLKLQKGAASEIVTANTKPSTNKRIPIMAINDKQTLSIPNQTRESLTKTTSQPQQEKKSKKGLFGWFKK